MSLTTKERNSTTTTMVHLKRSRSLSLSLSHIYICTLKFLSAEILNFVADSAADEKETKLSKTIMAKASRVRIEPEILCPSSK